MKKRSISVICLMLALLIALPASAAPIVSGSQGYTACIGENNYLYLTDASGITKVLQTPIANLEGMTEEFLYCTTADSRQYEVKLDGSSSRVVTEESLTMPAAPFALEEGILIPRSASGQELSGIPNVVAACADENGLYYVTPNTAGGYDLLSISLPLADNTVPAGTLMLTLGNKPLSMTLSPESVTIVAENDLIEIFDRELLLRQTYTRPGAGVTHAYAYNGKLVLLAQNENGQFTVLSSEEHTRPFITTTPVPVSVASVSTATAAPTAVATVKPTNTPKPTAKPVEDDGRISKGDTGYDVRKMQRRLMELGYPVGTVDGDFGDNTLLAVNLFQCAIGYRNRSYASEAMLNKLYSKKAPAYDPYAPLKEGDEGADVKIMQTFLHDLGYDVGVKGIDGKFGKDTKAAVEQFQFVAGLEVTGEADAETLKLLLDEEKPIPNATATPVPPPTEAPTQEPTQEPTQAPTQEPTAPPTETPATPSDL